MSSRASTMNTARSGNLLGALACAVVEQLEAELKTHPNQNSSWFAALNLIRCFDGCSNSQLGRALGLSHPATVRLVDKLEVAGLVTRARGQDRRSVALHLTSHGRRRVQRVQENRARVLEELVDRLDSDQHAALESLAVPLLGSLTTSPLAGAHLCRFCDEERCQRARCPVHLRAVRLAGMSEED